MMARRLDPSKYNIPPLRIEISDLPVDPTDKDYSNAVKAVKAYQSQAVVMTKEEQEEFYDLVVVKQMFRQKNADRLLDEMTKDLQSHLTDDETSGGAVDESTTGPSSNPSSTTAGENGTFFTGLSDLAVSSLPVLTMTY
jgi:hypothetical protein